MMLVSWIVPAAIIPPLLAKSWAVGYTVVGLGILLGYLAVAIPSMRTATRKREN